MTTVVKLQRIGNSIRATIPKEVAEELSLRPGEDMIVSTVNDAVVLKRRRMKGIADFYGALKERSGKVKHWPTPEEIKGIWD